MDVTCLIKQEPLFETRLLRRMAQIHFINESELQENLRTPLFLYGIWYPGNFWEGLNWLSSFAYKLPFPCVLFPPLEQGQINTYLKLQIQLRIKSINSNHVIVQTDEFPISKENNILNIQTDFGFEGPAGKRLVITSPDEIGAVVMVQPKNTSTPLLFCGCRVFSASGLSSDEDRQILIEGLVNWSTKHKKQDVDDEQVKTPEKQLEPDKLNSISVIIGGTGSVDQDEIRSFSLSFLGLELSNTEIELGLLELMNLGYIQEDQDSYNIMSEAFDEYLRNKNLWALVRIIRKEVAQKRVIL